MPSRIFPAVVCLALALLSSLHAETKSTLELGGHLKWARLKTESPSWDRHARSDPRLLTFMRTSATLDIDTTWHVADVENLRQMCLYPFLFSEGLHHVTDLPGRANLREYLQRGGFIFIDSCINTNVNPDPDAFLQMQIDLLKSLRPDARVVELPPDHEIYRICYKMKEGLPHTYMENIYDPAWAKHGLCAVYSGDQLISIISLSGLQCGWDGMQPDREHIEECMKMMLNIYAYVITH